MYPIQKSLLLATYTSICGRPHPLSYSTLHHTFAAIFFLTLLYSIPHRHGTYTRNICDRQTLVWFFARVSTRERRVWRKEQKTIAVATMT